MSFLGLFFFTDLFFPHYSQFPASWSKKLLFDSRHSIFLHCITECMILVVFLISIEFFSARQWSYLWLGLILLRLVFESLDCPFFLEFSLLLRYILFEFSEWSAKVLYWVLWMISKDSTVASWSSTVFLPFLSSETVQVTIFWSPFVCLCAF